MRYRAHRHDCYHGRECLRVLAPVRPGQKSVYGIDGCFDTALLDSTPQGELLIGRGLALAQLKRSNSCNQVGLQTVGLIV